MELHNTKVLMLLFYMCCYSNGGYALMVLFKNVMEANNLDMLPRIEMVNGPQDVRIRYS